jgi:hypothetical protein
LRPSNRRESWWPLRQLWLGALEVEQAQEAGGETLAAGRATTDGLARGRPVPFVRRKAFPGLRVPAGLANGWARRGAAAKVD